MPAAAVIVMETILLHVCPSVKEPPPAFSPSIWNPSPKEVMSLIQFVMRNMKKPIFSVMWIRYCSLSPDMNFRLSSHEACTTARMMRRRRQYGMMFSAPGVMTFFS